MIPCNSVARGNLDLNSAFCIQFDLFLLKFMHPFTLAQFTAPSGCLQYFTGISGSVRSFNFQGGAHLANMDYSVCIRPEDGMRFIDVSRLLTNYFRS